MPLDAAEFPAHGSFDVAEACPSMFPYKDEMDFKKVVPDDDMVNAYLLEDWGEHACSNESRPCRSPEAPS